MYVASGLSDMYSKCVKKDLAKHTFYKCFNWTLDRGCWNFMRTNCSFNSFDEELSLSLSRGYGMECYLLNFLMLLY